MTVEFRSKEESLVGDGDQHRKIVIDKTPVIDQAGVALSGPAICVYLAPGSRVGPLTNIMVSTFRKLVSSHMVIKSLLSYIPSSSQQAFSIHRKS